MLTYSFILPIYNCSEYLRDCIDSIMNIGLESMEIILIDDGSVDNSSELCDQLALTSRSIKVCHQKNRGASTARNIGIEIAEGERIVFVDGDDTIDSPLARKIFTKEELNKDADLVISGFVFEYFRQGKVYRKDERVYPKRGILEPSEWHQEFLQLYKTNYLSPVWSKVFKRKIIIDNSIRFNSKLISYEDLDFTVKYLSCCGNISIYDLPIYKYRQSEDEGNSIRRLTKVSDLSQLVGSIEESLELLIEKQGMDDSPKKILFSLYSSLSRDKISISSRQQILEICKGFKKWYYSHVENIDQLDVYTRYMLNEQINMIMIRRRYLKIRHGLAVIIKSVRSTVIGTLSK